MAGRGGKSSSLTKDQLQAMGISGKDVTPSGQMPPPLFPQLVNKPKLPDHNMERQYKIMWKDDFATFLKDSPYFLPDKSASNDRLSDEELGKVKDKPNFCWNLMPPELKPNFKRGTTATTPGAKPALVKRSKPAASVEEKLKQLEEKESMPMDTSRIKPEPKDDDEEEEEEEQAADDDEMDEENDYGNDYFDNGEAFNEEDDNLDDGPVY